MNAEGIINETINAELGSDQRWDLQEIAEKEFAAANNWKIGQKESAGVIRRI
jgi:hypothetical protein